MMTIFVRNNPNNIVYNAYVLMFVHSWYMPTRMGEPVKEDSWLRVPAVKSQPFNQYSNPVYTPVNVNLSLISTLDIAEDDGRVIKAFRARPGKQIERQDLDKILKEAVDISAWEKANDQSWPFHLMFDQQLIKYRFEQKHGNADRSEILTKSSSNITYNSVRSKVVPKPCNCGRPKY